MKHIMNFFLPSIFLLAFFSLSACGEYERVNENVSANERRAERAIATIAPNNIPKTPLRVDERPWYGMQAVPMTNGSSLPANVNQSDSIVMTFAQPVDMFEAVQMIQSVTGIRTVVSNNVYEESLGEGLAARMFMPSGGEEVSGGRIVWSGRLENLLNQVSDTFGAEWTYDGSAIRFASEASRTFMLHALASQLTVTGNAGTGGGTANVPQLSVDGTTTLEMWGEISEAVEGMIGDQGQASFSPTTGSITVVARPEVLKRVENYLRYQNNKRLRRVAVSVQVLSVQTSDTYTTNFDLSGVIKAALGPSTSFVNTINGDGGVFTVSKSAAENAGDVTSRLEADEGISRASIVHSGSLVTLSDQPAPLQVGRQIAYIERVSAASGDGASASLEPGTVDVGLFMTVLPRIVENDKILMRLSVAITDAQTPFRSFESGDVRIELPEIETTGFIQNAVVNDGETLVLAGF
jgi:type IVB pilus formation R64 PilN family outer membrane protein